MTNETIQLTEYQINTIVGEVSYFDNSQRDLVRAALAIYRRKHSNLDEDGVKDMLRDLSHAGLISEGGVDSVLKKMFK